VLEQKVGLRRPTVITGGLLALAALAWLITDVRMDGMAMDSGDELGTLGWFAVTWVVMMAAMMLPALAPAAIRQRHNTAGFVAGYLVPWAAAGVVAYALIEALGQPSRYVADALILAAAAYQLTGPKGACLNRCRGTIPLAERGALASGVEYGVFCVGCCWALMAALFALGIMSVGWMVVVAALITAERLLPWRTSAIRGVAVVLAVLAVGVTLAPADSNPGMDDHMNSMEAPAR
jgi:predicted metal-binding membrane protein